MPKQTQFDLKNSLELTSFFACKFSIFDSNRNRFFSFTILCICSFFSNLIITGSSTVVLSTLEKEFFLTSFESGLFLSLFELGGFVSSPIFGFFGSLKTKKKLHLISFSLFLLLLGSYLIGFLVFLKKPKHINLFNTTDSLTNSLCSILANEKNIDSRYEAKEQLFYSDCSAPFKSNESNVNYKLILYAGHFIIGLGSVAIYTVGIAYVEEIALDSKSALWQGILYGAGNYFCTNQAYLNFKTRCKGSIGGGIGFLISGQFLNINSRFYTTENQISENNVNWIGAWWLPYVVYGTICGILCVLVFLFGFYSFNKNNTINEEMEINQINFNKSLRNFIKNFGKNFLNSFKNIQLLFITFSMVTEGVILKGFLGFMSKYIEYQFEMKASDATLALGIVALISVITGTLLSAKIIEKCKYESKECAFMCLIIFFLTSFCFLILFNYCPEVKFINQFESFNCSQCNCANQFDPVCIQSIYDNATNVFQSACHAGCVTPAVNNYFQNCECLKNNFELNETISILNCSASLKCSSSLIINGIAAFLIVFFTAMSLIPHLKSLLGCVNEKDQSLALGLKNSIVVIFGNFAGTLLVGYSVDITCKYWQYNCFDQKVCKLYDNFMMSVSLALIGFGCRFVSALLMIYPTVKYYKIAKKNAQHQFEFTSMKTRF